MIQYLKLVNHVLKTGFKKTDRTNTGTLSIFGYQMKFDLQEGFPLVTTKKLHMKSIICELLWMLKGETNIKYLNDNNVTIWDEWADKDGELGRVYGYQWRNWTNQNQEKIDQISNIIKDIKTNPDSRRLVVSTWNVGDLNLMNLPPCHILFQFYVHNNELSCQLYQRSADIFLGLPFNIAFYSLLTMMVAKVCNLKPKTFIHTLGDAHIYLNHIKQLQIQIQRKPKPLSQIEFPVKNSIFSYEYDDFSLKNYNPHPHISGKVAV